MSTMVGGWSKSATSSAARDRSPDSVIRTLAPESASRYRRSSSLSRRVDRDLHHPGAGDGEVALHVLEAVAQQDRRPGRRARRQPGQDVGQPPGPVADLGEGQAAVAVDHRHARAIGASRPLDQLRDGGHRTSPTRRLRAWQISPTVALARTADRIGRDGVGPGPGCGPHLPRATRPRRRHRGPDAAGPAIRPAASSMAARSRPGRLAAQGGRWGAGDVAVDADHGVSPRSMRFCNRKACSSISASKNPDSSAPMAPPSRSMRAM